VTIPLGVTEGVSRFLGARIIRQHPVGGGCIHHGARIETGAGSTFFLKWNDAAPVGMFEAEADGLRALRATGTLRAPEPLAWDATSGGAWLLLECVQPARAAADTAERLGRGLTALHACATEPTFGWRRDNWIGSLPQANAPTRSWADFWRERRIAPQLELARRHGRLLGVAGRVLDRVIDAMPRALADVTRPELVHGDLWGGNWLVAEGGEPVLIDPAVYRGHGEVDLAMTELFGGFERAFYDGYADARGISGAYSAYRRDLYQLYYLLVHVNLFGASYEASALAAAKRVVAELSA